MSTVPNVFILAADNSPSLLPLLQSNPTLALSQDSTGYSLLHAAASYNHADLVRALVKEFSVPVDILDSDNETALFQTETIEIAKLLVEELGANVALKNDEGLTAAEKIENESDYPLVAAYLRGIDGTTAEVANVNGTDLKLPGDMKVTFTSADDIGEDAPVDEDFRRKIEELASRGDFEGEGQKELRTLVEEAVRGKILNQDDEDQRRKRA